MTSSRTTVVLLGSLAACAAAQSGGEGGSAGRPPADIGASAPAPGVNQGPAPARDASSAGTSAPSDTTADVSPSLDSRPDDSRPDDSGAMAAAAADVSARPLTPVPGGWMIETVDDRSDPNFKAGSGDGTYTVLTCKGTVQDDNGKLTMNACGKEVWHNEDYFTFVYRALDGDGEVVARIDSVQAGVSAKFGVMMRNEPLFKDPDQPGAMVFYQGGNITWGDRLYVYDPAHGRAGDGWGPGPSTCTAKGVPLPVYVRITRKGNAVAGFYSADGKQWLPVPANSGGHKAQNTLRDTTNRMWVGIFGAPTQAGKLVTGVFSDVVVKAGTVSP